MIKIGSLILTLSYFILANISATVDTANPSKGDLITYEITAQGNNINFPNISHIAQMPIISKGTSTNVAYINGAPSRSVTKSFSFYINNDLVIPSFIISIDGANYQSNEIRLKINNNKNKTIQIISTIEDKELYLSQITQLRATIIRNPNLKILDISLQKPNLEDFWVEEVKQGQAYKKGNLVYQDIIYNIYPQKIGNLKIEPFRLDILLPSKRKTFFFSNQNLQKQLYSNALNITVKDIPKETNIVGDFNFKIQTNKKKAKANDAISLEILIQGRGNLNDIDPFTFELNNANSYSAKPEIKNNTFKQVITIISDTNYTIPSLSFKYFSIKDKKLIHKKSQKINIQIDGQKKEEIFISQKNQIKKIQKTKEIIIYKETPLKQKLIYVALGMLLNLIIYIVIQAISKIIKNIKNKEKLIIPKQNKALLSFLIPYKNNDKIKEWIKKLEENIYANKTHKINRKEIKNIIKYYNFINN